VKAATPIATAEATKNDFMREIASRAKAILPLGWRL